MLTDCGHAFVPELRGSAAMRRALAALAPPAAQRVVRSASAADLQEALAAAAQDRERSAAVPERTVGQTMSNAAKFGQNLRNALLLRRAFEGR